jgi:hypothetical protein
MKNPGAFLRGFMILVRAELFLKNKTGNKNTLPVVFP